MLGKPWKQLTLAEVLTVAQAAKRLRIAPRTIHKYFRRGLLRRAGKLGATPLLLVVDVDRFARDRRRAGKPKQPKS